MYHLSQIFSSVEELLPEEQQSLLFEWGAARKVGVVELPLLDRGEIVLGSGTTN